MSTTNQMRSRPGGMSRFQRESEKQPQYKDRFSKEFYSAIGSIVVSSARVEFSLPGLHDLLADDLKQGTSVGSYGPAAEVAKRIIGRINENADACQDCKAALERYRELAAKRNSVVHGYPVRPGGDAASRRMIDFQNECEFSWVDAGATTFSKMTTRLPKDVRNNSRKIEENDLREHTVWSVEDLNELAREIDAVADILESHRHEHWSDRFLATIESVLASQTPRDETLGNE